MKPAPGLTVTANVRLLRELGRGGMGCVWAAEHLTLGTEVAVKLITEGREEGPEAVSRFKLEAQAAAKITSPHVVRTYDQGVTEDGTPYIVMELLRGETLADRLAGSGPLDVERLALVMKQAGLALDAAHELGIVHRDIKPDNIFLVDVGGELFVKVLDFGIAKHTLDSNSLTATGSVFGTPKYMSPEQLVSAKHVDRRTDLWALAVVGFEALTGQLPFDAESLVGLCMAIQTGRFTPPSKLRAEVSSGVDRWFLKALATRPEDRYESARQMVRAFATASALSLPNTADLVPAAAQGAAAAEPAVAATVAWSPEPDPRPVAHEQPAAGQPAAGQPAAGQPAAGQPAAAQIRPLPVASPPSGGKGAAVMVATVGIGLLAASAVAAWLLLETPDPAGDRPQRGQQRGQQGALPSVSSEAPGRASSSSPSPSSSASATGPTDPLVEVAAGQYWLGCRPDLNRECYDDEKPARKLALKGYAIMRREVTVGEYRACVQAGDCPPRKASKGCSPSDSDDAGLPVTCVDWRGARAYCRFRNMRLPHEAEWEAAALGTDHRDFPWGSDPASCARTVMAGEGEDCAGDKPRPPGSRAPDRSWCGALDMGGNVREWTGSSYAAYSRADGGAGGGAGDELGDKVNRGGSYAMNAEQFDTSHTRRQDRPELARPDLGFRCAVGR